MKKIKEHGPRVLLTIVILAITALILIDAWIHGYDAPLKRYLWCQALFAADPRFKGGMGIFDAPQPWGPWTTVFYTQEWDMGPGESSSFPTKWISADGKTLHLVFSGEDSFSVRRATLRLHVSN